MNLTCKENLYSPLVLRRVLFNPLQNGFDKENIAATEINGNTREGNVEFKNIRKDVIQGEVHDEKAFYTMNGVSGHAGLFSNSHDLAVLMQVMVNGGGYGHVKLFDEKIINDFISPSTTNDTYSLGWRRKGSAGYYWAFGKYSSPNTVGHTGWTGTTSIIDIDNDIVIVWLSNTKNTPIADTRKDVNRMFGDAFQFDSGGTLSTLVYEGIIGCSDDSLEKSILQIAIDRNKVLQDEISKNGNCTEADYMASSAIVDVLLSKAEKDRNDQTFQRALTAYRSMLESKLKKLFKNRLEKINTFSLEI